MNAKTSTVAVLGISQGMADFLGPFGIRVNSVSPTVVDGGMMGDRRVGLTICSKISIEANTD